MKFRCERDVLLAGLTTVGRAVGKGATLPVLTGVHMVLAGEMLMLTCSDLDLTLSTRTEVLSAGEEGSAVPPAKLLTEIIKSLDSGVVDIDTDEEELRVTSGRSHFTMRLFPVADFPRLPEPSGEPIVIPAADLHEAISQVAPAAWRDDTRPVLTGVLVTAEADGLRLAATDSYRLAVRDLPGVKVGLPGQVLVPSRAMSELAKLASHAEEVEVIVGTVACAFLVDGTTMITKLIEGEYPDYRKLIPETSERRMVVNAEDLAGAIKRCRTVSDQATNAVRMELTEGEAQISIVTPHLGSATEAVKVDYDGPDMTIAFNPGYLAEGIEACRAEEVAFHLNDPLRPVVLRHSGGGDYIYLVMPVRVS